MKCGRKGCNNIDKGNRNFKSVVVKDERSRKGLSNEYSEKWCLECVGSLQPHKYTLVYYAEMNKLKMKRVPKEVEEVAADVADVNILAPINEEPVNRSDAAAMKRAKAGRKVVVPEVAPIEGR